MTFLKNTKSTLALGVLLLFIIPLSQAQNKQLKRPKTPVGVASVDTFVKESFDIYDKVYTYDGYAETGKPLDDEDIDVLEEALDDLQGLSDSAPDILGDIDGISVIKQGKAALQMNKAKKALKYSIKTAKELLLGQRNRDEKEEFPDYNDDNDKQSEDKKPTNTDDESKNEENNSDNLKIYKSPMKEYFKDIRLQTFNGLLRVGKTYSSSDNLLGSINGFSASKKTKTNPLENYNYRGYFRLFDLVNNIELFDHLGENYILSGNPSNEYTSQNQAQTDLIWIKRALEQTKLKYHYGQEFKGNNQFEINRNYQSYIKKELPVIKSWGKKIFQKNSIEAYYVFNAYLKLNYDFKNQGFWLNPSTAQPNPRGFSVLNGQKFTLIENENSFFNNKKKGGALLPFTPNKAEKLINRLSSEKKKFFFVQKIKLYYLDDNSQNDGNNSLITKKKCALEFTSNIIEVYLGDELTEKVAEFNLSDLKREH